jgi:formate/nitrite transporter FocA (FNT family)
VTPVLDERRHVAGTLRLWTVVFVANLVGTLAFATIAVPSGAVPGDIVHELSRLGRELSSGDWTSNLWSGVMAGWLLAAAGVLPLQHAASQAPGELGMRRHGSQSGHHHRPHRRRTPSRSALTARATGR